MSLLSHLVVGLVALLHLWFLVLEMFFWRKPLGLKTFKMTREYAEASASLAANQGLYNGFLAAGLVWGLLLDEPRMALHVKVFFLSCVVVAGLFGGLVSKRVILYVQMIPGVVTLALVCFAAA
jgi:putative membrane protein